MSDHRQQRIRIRLHFPANSPYNCKATRFYLLSVNTYVRFCIYSNPICCKCRFEGWPTNQAPFEQSEASQKEVARNLTNMYHEMARERSELTLLYDNLVLSTELTT